jgi:hypothetical protein
MIEVRVPKEIRHYKEKLFFGLNVRQTFSIILALSINIPLYIFIRPYIGDELASWLIILTAGPLILIGFFNYNGMPFEHFILCIVRFQFLTPQKRKYVVENLYDLLMDMYYKEQEWGEKYNTIIKRISKLKKKDGGDSIEVTR